MLLPPSTDPFPAQLAASFHFFADSAASLSSPPSFLHDAATAAASLSSSLLTSPVVVMMDEEPSSAAGITTAAAAATTSVFLLSPETTLAPLNGSSEFWVRSLVWSDFRVAVSFFVVVPFVLLSWAVVARFPSAAPKKSNNNNPEDPYIVNVDDDARSPTAETVLRLMTSYWQASSLLLLTVALNIQESNAGVFAGLFAQAMIFASLWWWEDLNEEIAASSEPIGRAYMVWRGVAGIAAALGVLVQVPFQGCVGTSSLVDNAWCAPWLEPPKFVADLLGLLDPSSSSSISTTLGLITNAGCTLYAAVLAYYAVILLPSVGRSGRAPRPPLMDVATPIGAWRALGFIDPQNSKP